MKTQYLKAKVLIKKEKDVITVIASDETLDRHGDVLPIESWDLTKFLSAPRMLIDHNHEVASIVGRWKNVRIEGKALLMDAEFHDFTDIAKAVKQMVEGDFLNTVSVGFIYNGPEGDGGRPSFELIETSWVTVPANPNARVVKEFEALKGKSITDEQKKEVEAFAGETKEDEDPEKEPEEEEEEKEPEIDPETGEPIIPEDIDEDDEIPEEDTFDDEKTFKEKCAEKKDEDVVKVSVRFLRELVERSEQLQTLTDKGLEVIRAKRSAALTRAALKEAAGIISHALREANKSSQ